ncbi:MAG: hypothetical protein QXP72_00735 [Desulfurococcaceae archaeon]
MEKASANESFSRIIEKIDILRKRLEQTTPPSICEDVYRTLGRIDVLKKNIDKLQELKRIISDEYGFLKGKLWLMKKTITLIVIPAVVSIVFISIYLVLITLIYTRLSIISIDSITTLDPFTRTVFQVYEENPWNYIYILVTGGLSIFLLIVMAGYAYKKNFKKAEYKELKEKIKYFDEKLADITSRINTLLNRYEKDSIQLTKLRETHTCICYNELNKLYSILESIKDNLQSLRIGVLSSEDRRSRLISIRDSIVELKNRGAFCASPLTDEFRIEIYIDDDVIVALDELIKAETIDWNRYIDSTIKFRFSSSPLIHSVPLLGDLRNTIS